MTEVVIRRLNRETTGFDPDFKVPTGALVYGLQESVRALVRWEADELVETATGDSWIRKGSFSVPAENEPGYKSGDKVERIGGQEITPPVYIMGSRPTARVRGRHQFVRYDFASRRQGI